MSKLLTGVGWTSFVRVEKVLRELGLESRLPVTAAPGFGRYRSATGDSLQKMIQPKQRSVQYFNSAYLAPCRQMKPAQIIEFLEGFRELHATTQADLARGRANSPRRPSRLISIKIPEDLLAAFRTKAELCGTAYQTQIKKLMQEWLLDEKKSP